MKFVEWKDNRKKERSNRGAIECGAWYFIGGTVMFESHVKDVSEGFNFKIFYITLEEEQ